jgi:hypothetical protein
VTPSARFEPHKLAAQFVRPQVPPQAHLDRVVYGLMQPVLGARMLLTDPALLRSALLPALLLALFCLVSAVLQSDGWDPRDIVREFYRTFAVLAPLPSLLLGRYYARLAVAARHKFAFSAAQPCIEPLYYAAKRWFKQLVIVAIGMLPVLFVLRFVPFVGRHIGQVVTALWAVHWIVVDAFDSARTLKPGQTLAQLDGEAERAPRPWFTRLLAQAADKLPIGSRFLHWFARRCDRLAMPWREEMALVEAHPSLAVGFAATTAALVATPVLNLLFRPIVIVAAAHVLGQLEQLESDPPALPPPSQSVSPAAG